MGWEKDTTVYDITKTFYNQVIKTENTVSKNNEREFLDKGQ